MHVHQLAAPADVVIRDRADRAMPGLGDVIDGRYEIRRELGRGGAGAVFEAMHVYTRRVVAIKLIREDAGTAVHEQKARLLREAQALAAARDPGIVDVLDAGVAANGMPFLVLECLEGRTLEGLLASRGKLGATDVVAIGLQLARSLGAAHRAGVVHRDVKPSNVFITRGSHGREQTKLVDFGIARLEQSGGRKLSLAGALIGTPEYMSPEQLLAKDDIDARSDIYALGVTLFECLTGEVPFTGSYAQVLLQSASPTPAPSVRVTAPHIPDALVRVVDRAIAKAREERYADMDAFVAALTAVAPSARRYPALLGPPPLPAIRMIPREDVVLLPETPAVDFTQRRRAPRAAYVTPVRIILDGRVLDGRSEDISESGMFVLCRGECPLGQSLAIRFASPIDGRVVTLSGRVRWVKALGRDKAQRAIGVEFDGVPEDVRASIARYAEMMEDPQRRDATDGPASEAACAE
jgi:hypothetical protein